MQLIAGTPCATPQAPSTLGIPQGTAPNITLVKELCGEAPESPSGMPSPFSRIDVPMHLGHLACIQNMQLTHGVEFLSTGLQCTDTHVAVTLSGFERETLCRARLLKPLWQCCQDHNLWDYYKTLKKQLVRPLQSSRPPLHPISNVQPAHPLLHIPPKLISKSTQLVFPPTTRSLWLPCCQTLAPKTSPSCLWTSIHCILRVVPS